MATMNKRQKEGELERRVAAVRRFNRFYTQQIGVLQEGLLKSPFSLTEVRVLYELAHRENVTAAELMKDLGLDRGYLSRILSEFERRGFVRKSTSKKDSRQNELSLTALGRKAFAPLNRRSEEEVATMLGRLAEPEQRRLVEAMKTVESLLGPRKKAAEPYVLRPPRPGDIGWVIHRHGALYCQEYGWDESFEALVAEISAKFMQNFDAKRERCWIAEKDGEIVGSVFVVKKSKDVAQLRMLLVEPSARGLGIGKRLVEECVRFARETGYKKMVLWTNSVLHTARHVYEEAGFRLVEEEKGHGFGEHQVSQTWEKQLLSR